MNEGNQRIIRNSLALYVRMAINLAIGLYTSRVVLNVLGVEDYGIYGVVAGVVSFMGFINAVRNPVNESKAPGVKSP